MTISENIAFGTRRALPGARSSGSPAIVEIDDEIDGFPDGYDTLVGERGVTLSGGQKQRVALARALAAEPRHPRPRRLPLQRGHGDRGRHPRPALAETRSRTSIIIAHRISTVRDADLILVLDDGRLVEQGTHEELLSERGLLLPSSTGCSSSRRRPAGAAECGTDAAEDGLTGMHEQFDRG